jgi:hypothetical protein
VAELGGQVGLAPVGHLGGGGSGHPRIVTRPIRQGAPAARRPRWAGTGWRLGRAVAG